MPLSGLNAKQPKIQLPHGCLPPKTAGQALLEKSYALPKFFSGFGKPEGLILL
jgi:hypothetical protein